MDESFLSSWTELWEQVSVVPPPFGGIVALIIAVVFLLCSGFISASELAFFSLSPADLNKSEEESLPSDHKIKKLRADSERLLATILISNNFVNVAIIILCNYFFLQIVDFGGSEILEFICITVLLTFLLLLFGEIIPKIYSAQHTLSFCRMASPVILVLQKIFYPFSGILVRSNVLATKIVRRDSRAISVDELEQALELTDKSEISEEQSMLKGIIRFGGETVKEVMTSRMDVVDLDIKSGYSEVLDCIVKNNYSRIPVYAGTQDNIKGVLYIKDLIPHLNKGEHFRWQSLIRPPFFVPETKMIDDLLRDFQTNKVHIAIVVDEFGGTSGLITMEDIIEEIVGEINDEYDDEERQYTRLNQNTYIFEAKILLSDFYKIMKVDETVFDSIVGEADTLAGLLLELKGEFPQLHEQFDYKQFQFEVMEMDERRIVKIKVKSKKEYDKPTA